MHSAGLECVYVFECERARVQNRHLLATVGDLQNLRSIAAGEKWRNERERGEDECDLWKRLLV